MLTEKEMNEIADRAADKVTAAIDNAGLTPAGKRVADAVVNGLLAALKRGALVVAMLVGPEEAIKMTGACKDAIRAFLDQYDEIDRVVAASFAEPPAPSTDFLDGAPTAAPAVAQEGGV